MTRLEIRDAQMCAKADARFDLARDLRMDGDDAGASHQSSIGWRMCRKAWKARAKHMRLKVQR